jgi:hypothetical protein
VGSGTLGISNSTRLIIPPDLAGGIGLAQMLGQTNIIALVGGGRMPKFAANKVSVTQPQIVRIMLTDIP